MRDVKTAAGRGRLTGMQPRAGVRRMSGARLTQARLGYLFLLPTLAAIIVFQYYPALSAIYHSFTQWDGIAAPTFVGFAQFQAFFGDPEFGQAVINILKLTGFGMLVAVTVPLGVARLILSVPSARQQFWLRLLFILPFMVPTVVSILLWQFIYNSDGVLNQILIALHLGNGHTDWLGNPHTAIYAVMLMGFPYVDGFGLLVYTAGLQAIPAEMKEAAAIDGAGALRIFWRIEIPQIVGQLRLMWVLAIINGIQQFTSILILTNGGPGYATTVPGLMMYQNAFSNQNFGEACAIGTALFVVILSVTIINMRLLRSSVDYDARRAVS